MGFSPCGRKEPDKTEPLTYSQRGELEGASLRALPGEPALALPPYCTMTHGVHNPMTHG